MSDSTNPDLPPELYYEWAYRRHCDEEEQDWEEVLLAIEAEEEADGN